MQTLSNYTKKTLGSGNLRRSVELPLYEDKNEWVAANLVDFYNELTLLYSIIAESAPKMYKTAGHGFPPGYEYRWAQKKRLIRCTCWEYCEYVFDWIEEQVNMEKIFPTKEGFQFPDNFLVYAKDIYKKMFRVYAIIYTSFFAMFKRFDAVKHLNTSFKHFMFFSFEFKLISGKESKALKTLVERLLTNYVALKSKH